VTHPVIAGGLAAQLDRLADIVKRNWTWPSPAAGFASWLFRRLGTPAFFAHPTAKFTPDLLAASARLPCWPRTATRSPHLATNWTRHSSKRGRLAYNV
jgi:hypothetical protein